MFGQPLSERCVFHRSSPVFALPQSGGRWSICGNTSGPVDVAVCRSGLQFSKQKQDEQDYDHEAQPAAAIVAGAVERTAANATKAAE
jgi:hypothetical protein